MRKIIKYFFGVYFNKPLFFLFKKSYLPVTEYLKKLHSLVNYLPFKSVTFNFDFFSVFITKVTLALCSNSFALKLKSSKKHLFEGLKHRNLFL